MLNNCNPFQSSQLIPDIVVRVHGHEWLLGEALCKISAHAVYIPGSANIAFIFSISLYRLLSCQFPLHFRDSVSQRQANVYSLLVWLWSFIPSIIYLCHTTETVFEPLSSDCALKFDKKSLVNVIIAGPYVVIPFVGLIVCNILLFYIASKSAARIGRSVKQASITIGAVSGLFVVSWLPYIVRQFIVMITKSELDWPFRPDILFYELSIFGNPIIYTIVNKRFKNYLKSKIISLVMGVHGAGQSRIYNSNSAPSLTEVAVKQNRKANQKNNKVHCKNVSVGADKNMHMKSDSSNNLINDITPTSLNDNIP